MRGQVCCLYLLLALTSAVILGSESHRTHDHILLSKVRDSSDMEGQVPVVTFPRNRVAQLYTQALRTPNSSQSHIATDGQSVSQ
jgi:hypothetical protein